MDLITVPKIKDGNEFINDLTKEIDKYLLDKLHCKYWSTYIYGIKPYLNGYYPLRYPGATRGYIKISNESIIEEIKFYNDIPPIYDNKVIEAVKSYIGSKLIFTKN